MAKQYKRQHVWVEVTDTNEKRPIEGAGFRIAKLWRCACGMERWKMLLFQGKGRPAWVEFWYFRNGREFFAEPNPASTNRGDANECVDWKAEDAKTCD